MKKNIPFLILFSCNAFAGEWPQYRGPNQDGTSSEKLALQKWPERGLPQMWKVPTPTGFSSFTVSGGSVFTVVAREADGVKREACVALDAGSGRELWAVLMCPAKYSGGGDSGGGGDGPRSTPTYNDGLVYAYDSQLLLQCLDARDGRVVWSKDIIKEFAGQNIGWQSAVSPVVEDKMVIVPGGGPGQSLLAFDKKTGAVIWKAQDDKMTHATPVVATIGGVRQLVCFMQKGLLSVDLATGKELWSYPFKYVTSTAASPVICDDLVYCSAGYGVGAGLVRISRAGDSFTATEVWRKQDKMMNHWSTPVFKDGYIYGIFGFKQYNKAPLQCYELATGKEMWSKEGFGPGNLILVDNHLVVLGDRGQLVLLKASPESYQEVSRIQAVGGKCWTTPAYSDGRIYVRSTTEGVCLDATRQTAAKQTKP